jgi:hypothetical protein
LGLTIIKMKKKRTKEKTLKGERACELVCKEEIFCWVPRVLAILFIIFISLFALDVFGNGENLGEVFLGLIIHLIPSIILIVLLLVSWRCEGIGGALFIVAGIIFTVFFNTYKEFITFMLISGPAFLVGILFWISAMKKGRKF